jgi:4-amino-4-deoxy-L-arabinose transferase-like glycosyltransferase
MLTLLRSFSTRNRIWLLLLLCPPAYLINLHLAAFTGDEAIRALVAYEMALSDNYVATTIHGASYINKPPLFNWLVLCAFKLYGAVNELPSRLVTLCFLVVFTVGVFRVVRRELGFDMGILTAFSVATSGRFLFYDAMLGLIDTTFSAVVYFGMMSLYAYGKRDKPWAFFLVSYALMAVGFMLKGLPAVVFQGITLLVACWFFDRLRWLFSVKHAVGIALAAVVVGAWLWWYAQYRPLEVLLPNLLHESAKRTVVAYSWSRFFKHLYEFPYKQLYHFLPWSLLLVCLFDRHVRTRLQVPFVRYNALVLLANLPLYWTSVHVEPRYLLMFVPLFNTVGLYLLAQHQRERSVHFTVVYGVWGALLVLISIACAALPFVPAVQYLGYVWYVGPLAALALGVLAALYFTDGNGFLWWFIGALLVVRIVFDLVVLQARHDESITTRARADVRALADKYRDRNWYVYGDAYIREPASFYFTQRLGRIIPRTTDSTLTRALYLVNPEDTTARPGVLLDSLQTDYSNLNLYLYGNDGKR